MEAKHTATPWTANTYGQLRSPDGKAIDVWGLGVAHAQRDSETEANAAFIVRACNAHDDLVKALQALYNAVDSCVELTRRCCSKHAPPSPPQVPHDLPRPLRR